MKLRRDYVEVICNMSKNIQSQNMCMRACVSVSRRKIMTFAA